MSDSPTNELGRAAAKRPTARLMKRARAVQLSMLPKIPAIEGLDIHTHYQPCDAVGGDFYDFFSVSPWELGVVMGDVSGHGIDAALTMAMAKKSIQLNGKGRSSPRETLLVTCADLAQDLPGNSFVTVFYGVLDLRTWRLTFASAGHTPPILFNPDRTPQLQAIPTRGVVMGAAFVRAMEQSLIEQSVQLRLGDTLFLYTDGLTEAPNTLGDQFGEPRVLRALDTAGEGDSRKIVSMVVEHLTQFVSGAEPEDDLTIVALRISGAAKPAARMPERKAGRTWPTNLRLPTSTFIGRAPELARLQEWLNQDGVVATIIGNAGLGKSRLALEAGRHVLEHLPGGVWVVDANQMREAEPVAEAVAHTLGIVASGDATPEAAVAASLEFRPPLLLILDNCESAEKQLNAMLQRWHKAAPRTRFMLTSREPLGIPGECVLALAPLTTPPKSPDRNSAKDNESFSLFVARARESNPGLALDDESATRIAAICRKVEGNPLAIELAAAQMRTLSPRQISEGLQRESETHRPPQKISKGSVAIAQPQAVDWTYDLLSDVEKSAFCQLSLMRGGFFLPAAEAVLDVSEFKDAPDPVDLLQSFCDKRLFQTQDTPYGTRFVLLPPMRAFGRRKRADSFSPAQEDALTRRFVEYFAKYSTDQEKRYHSRAAVEALDRLEYDLENIFAAQDHALALGQPELSARAIFGISPLLEKRGPGRERIPRFSRALDRLGEGPVELKMRLYMALGQACFIALTGEKGIACITAAIGLARQGHSEVTLSEALAIRSAMLASRGDMPGALRDIKQARQTISKSSDVLARCRVELYGGQIAFQVGKFAEGLACFESSEPLIRAAGDLPLLASCMNGKSIMLAVMNRRDDALVCAKENEELLRRLRSTEVLATQLGNMGVIYRDMGRLDEALDCFQQAETGQREVGDRLALGRTLGNIANLYLLLDEFETARKYAFEGLTFATRQGDKDGVARVNLMLGHAAYAQGRFAEALACYETAIVINAESGHDIQAAECRAFAALCRMELGQAAEAETELNGLLKQYPARTASTLPFLLLASRARAEFAQGKHTRAKESLDEALALADRDSNSQYSSNRVVQVIWQIIDALQAAGIRDLSAPDTIKVRCDHCHRKVRGTRKRLDDLVACPVCKVTPFKYGVIEG